MLKKKGGCDCDGGGHGKLSGQQRWRCLTAPAFCLPRAPAQRVTDTSRVPAGSPSTKTLPLASQHTRKGFERRDSKSDVL